MVHMYMEMEINMMNKFHEDGDLHGEQVLWRWRSPEEQGSY